MSNSNIPPIDILTDTWQTAINRTNSLISSLSAEIVTANSTNGITGTAASPRNSTLIGTFTANTLTVPSGGFSVNSSIISLSSNKLAANGSTGVSLSVLTSGGPSGNVYWRSLTTANGTVTNVANGSGLIGGPITTTGTLSVKAGTGIVVNANGVNVVDSTLRAELANTGGGTLVNFTHTVTNSGRDFSGGTAFNTTGASLVVRGANSTFNPHGMEFYTGGSERMRLNNVGNLGIGTLSPTYRVDCFGSYYGFKHSAVSNGYYSTIEGGSISSSPYYACFNSSDTRLGYFGYFNGTTLTAAMSDSTTAVNLGTNGIPRLTILGGGNIGIGTSTPNANLSFGSLQSNKLFCLYDDSTNQYGMGIGSNEYRIYAASGADISFGTYVRGTDTFTQHTRLGSNGSVTSANLADAVGYKGLPPNAQTTSYTLANTDAGKIITTTAGVIIPSNAANPFPVGTAISIFNSNTSPISVTITSDFLYLAANTTSGTRALAGYGLATLIKVNSTSWVMSGAGVS